jgi:hypothetical protein
MGLIGDLLKLRRQVKEIQGDLPPAGERLRTATGLMGDQARDARVLEHGTGAIATIVAAVDTGARVSEQPVVKLELRVEPDVGAPFAAAIERMVPQYALGLCFAGAQVPVMFEPTDHTAIVLLWGMPPRHGGAAG